MPIFKHLIDVILPPRCGGCRAITDRPDTLCATCWHGLDLLGPNICDRCGVPFDIPVSAGMVCGQCLATPPAYDRARSVFRYKDTGRQLVLALKHTDRMHLARIIGRMMARLIDDDAGQKPLLIPVPLHWSRLWHRQYNQSELLARAMSTQKPDLVIMNDLVLRQRATRPQGSPGAASRADNVRNAFRLDDAARIKGQNVILIDDVMTSGSTVQEIARLLRKAQPALISVITAARVGHE